MGQEKPHLPAGQIEQLFFALPQLAEAIRKFHACENSQEISALLSTWTRHQFLQVVKNFLQDDIPGSALSLLNLYSEPDLDVLYLKIDALMDLKRYTEVISVADPLLQKEPGQRRLRFKRMKCYYLLGRELEAWSDRIFLLSENSPHSLALHRAYVKRSKYFLEENRLDSAVQDLQSALASYQEPSGDYYYMLGEVAVAFGDYQLAIEHYTRSLEVNDEDRNWTLNYVYLGRFFARRDLGRFEWALEDLTRSLLEADSSERLASILVVRVSLYEQLSDTKRAVGDIDLGLKLDPENVFLQAHSNRLCGTKFHPKNRKRSLDSASELYSLALSHFKSCDFEEALRCFEQCESLSKGFLDVQIWKIRTLRELGRFHLAEPLCRALSREAWLSGQVMRWAWANEPEWTEHLEAIWYGMA